MHGASAVLRLLNFERLPIIRMCLESSKRSHCIELWHLIQLNYLSTRLSHSPLHETCSQDIIKAYKYAIPQEQIG